MPLTSEFRGAEQDRFVFAATRPTTRSVPSPDLCRTSTSGPILLMPTGFAVASASVLLAVALDR
jgi:hypothetical protein